MPSLDLPRASRPLTEAHRVLIRLLAEQYVEELDGGSHEPMVHTGHTQGESSD